MIIRAPDSLVRFNVTANVVVKQSGKRRPVTDMAALTNWIGRYINDVSELVVNIPAPMRFCKRKRTHNTAERSGILHRVEFSGVGIVSDEAFCSGIGHARSFGLGMIQCSRL